MWDKIIAEIISNIDLVIAGLVGAIASAIGAIIGIVYKDYKTRKKQKEEKLNFAINLLNSLDIEIKEGIKRCETIIEIAMRGEFSLSRIYTDLWDASKIKIIEIIEDVEIIKSIHKIYLRFDLINFNLSRTDKKERNSGISFAQQYLGEMRENYNIFTESLKKLNKKKRKKNK